jgi:Fe-S-cluster containining protein
MSNICLGCGLCCDGTIFATVSLYPADDVHALRAAGVALPVPGGAASFHQPCPALSAGCCGVYEQRPGSCRDYRCALRRRYDGNEISFGEARTVIDTAIALRDAVRPELERLTQSTAPSSLKHMYRLAQTLLEAPDDPVRSRREHGRLLLAMASLQRFLARHFQLPDSKPEPGN